MEHDDLIRFTDEANHALLVSELATCTDGCATCLVPTATIAELEITQACPPDAVIEVTPESVTLRYVCPYGHTWTCALDRETAIAHARSEHTRLMGESWNKRRERKP
jgi:hypothetical protein